MTLPTTHSPAHLSHASQRPRMMPFCLVRVLETFGRVRVQLSVLLSRSACPLCENGLLCLLHCCCIFVLLARLECCPFSSHRENCTATFVRVQCNCPLLPSGGGVLRCCFLLLDMGGHECYSFLWHRSCAAARSAAAGGQGISACVH